MNHRNFYTILRYAAMAGNAVYIVWIVYNGIDEGFRGTIVQMVSFTGLITLLILDTVLICRKK